MPKKSRKNAPFHFTLGCLASDEIGRDLLFLVWTLSWFRSRIGDVEDFSLVLFESPHFGPNDVNRILSLALPTFPWPKLTERADLLMYDISKGEEASLEANRRFRKAIYGETAGDPKKLTIIQRIPQDGSPS